MKLEIIICDVCGIKLSPKEAKKEITEIEGKHYCKSCVLWLDDIIDKIKKSSKKN